MPFKTVAVPNGLGGYSMLEKYVVQMCELPGHEGPPAAAIGKFMVWDTDFQMPTMTRPAYLCQACIDFAQHCGMEARPVPE